MEKVEGEKVKGGWGAEREGLERFGGVAGVGARPYSVGNRL